MRLKRCLCFVFLQFPKGQFPIRYLGSPLSPKKLRSSDYDPLVTKLVSKIQSWTARKLSYAGRLVLIQSVLHSIERFWASVFVFPVGVLKKLQMICRNFLWSGGLTGRKSTVAWASLCQPKSQGGMGIKEVLSWNKSVQSNFLFELMISDTQSIWHAWIHTYVLKGGDIWSIPVKQSFSSWMKSVLYLRDQLKNLLTGTDIQHLKSLPTKHKVKALYNLF